MHNERRGGGDARPIRQPADSPQETNDVGDGDVCISGGGWAVGGGGSGGGWWELGRRAVVTAVLGDSWISRG